MSIEYYQNNADEFFKETVDVDMCNIYQAFVKHVPANALILDAGCGSGRDTKAFLDMGYKVEAFDASSEMVSRASAHTGIEVNLATFNDVKDVEKYDGIWCCASLLHVAQDELLGTLRRLSGALKSNGVMYVSFKHGSSQREADGRVFTNMNGELLSALVDQMSSIEIHSSWITKDSRPDRDERWFNAILLNLQMNDITT